MTPAEPGSTQGELWPYEEARKLAERAGGYEREPSRRSSKAASVPRGCRIWARWARCCAPPTCATRLQLLEPGAPMPRLIVFIDDMDGLRKVPESIPNREADRRLYRPAGVAHPRPVRRCCPSFAAHMIGMLAEFLEPVAVDYELMRSSEMYASGLFDDGAAA